MLRRFLLLIAITLILGKLLSTIAASTPTPNMPTSAPTSTPTLTLTATLASTSTPTPTQTPKPTIIPTPTPISMKVIATAYCLRGITFSGTSVKKGVVAVDPKVIPLRSTLFIPGYGWAKAEDTGGAIEGNRIDVWFPSCKQAIEWGVKHLEILVYLP